MLRGGASLRAILNLLLEVLLPAAFLCALHGWQCGVEGPSGTL